MTKRSKDQKLRSRNFDARNERIESGALVKNRSEQRRVQKRTRRVLAMESQRAVFERRYNCSFWHNDNKRAKQTLMPAPCSRTFDATGWKRYTEKEKFLEAESCPGKHVDCRARSTFKVPVRIHLSIIGTLPNVDSTKQNLDLNSWKRGVYTPAG